MSRLQLIQSSLFFIYMSIFIVILVIINRYSFKPLLFLGTYDARWRVLILYVTSVFDLDLSTVDNFELNVVNCLSNFLPAQTE